MTEETTMRRGQTNTSTQSGFTLIELLVVIAIIVILAAIIFPVFASVRENARQSSSINNLRQISTAIGQFELDNHKAPDALFGYVYYQYVAGTGGAAGGNTGGAVSMDSAYAQATADAQAYGANVSATFPGLYPEYVRDVSAFRDPNNPDNGDVPFKTADVRINNLGTSGTLAPDAAVTPHHFYVDDAYDISPVITGTNTVGTTYVPRYQASWTAIDSTLNAACTGATPPATCANNANYYTHQIRWKNPPAETYVTSTTYHVPSAATVLVLWEGGSVKKLSTAQFTLGANTETADITASSSGVSNATFWHLIPAGR